MRGTYTSRGQEGWMGFTIDFQQCVTSAHVLNVWLAFGAEDQTQCSQQYTVVSLWPAIGWR